MGASFISQRISLKYVEDLKVLNDREFSFIYKSKVYNVYCPTHDDYEISIELIDRVIRKSYNIVVYDSWIIATTSGLSYAEENRIPVYCFDVFLRKVRNNEPL